MAIMDGINIIWLPERGGCFSLQNYAFCPPLYHFLLITQKNLSTHAVYTCMVLEERAFLGSTTEQIH